MIKVNEMYPHGDGRPFDTEHYTNYRIDQHVPVVLRPLETACQGSAVEMGT